jgi:hypothetical protein
MLKLCLATLLISSVCFAQPAKPPLIPLPKITPPTPVSPPVPKNPVAPPPATAQPPASGEELIFLRFLLLNVASLDHSPDAIKAYEESLVLQFGLSTQESAAIHSAGQSLNTVLAELRQSTKTLVTGKPVLAPADVAELTSLNTQREQTISTLANQILNSVSATTATRLRSPGHILAKPIAVK